MSGLDERRARALLTCVTEPGDLDVGALVAQFSAVEVIERLRATPDTRLGRRLAALDSERVWRRAEAVGAELVIPGDPHWPTGLDDLATVEHDGRGGAPLGVWVRGPLSLAALNDPARPPAVAMVGSRASTDYGVRAARGLAADLAQAGHVVVSGGAYGIDAAAHAGALTEGPTIAVLACGVDEPYPRGNAALFRRLFAEHAVVSELPPGEHPTRLRFLTRNRIIAALSAGVIVVEAALRSGARSTVSWAHHLGRPVMAVPGPFDSVQSQTPHDLVRRQEAQLVTTAGQVSELLAPMGQELLPIEHGPIRVLDELERTTREVFEQLPGRGGRSAAELALRCGLHIGEVLSCLDELAEVGLARRLDGGLWGIVPGAVG